MRGRMQGSLTALVLCYLMISDTFGKASSCIPEERDVLLAFKAGVRDPGDKLSSWQGKECCKWRGVACSNKTLHVIKLDVSQYGLRGEINSSLAALTMLEYLNLSHNDFGGVAIPEFVGGFNKLRYLDLSRSNFGGKVPQLSNLSSLEHLDLNSFNSSTIQIEGLSWVSGLTSLRFLDLGWVYLAASSDWLQALSKLPLLHVLHLNDAFLPGTNLDSISHVNFTALTVLDLANNGLNSCLPNWIWRLHSLSYLDLSSCQLYGSVPDKIGNLTSLEFLHLRDNHLKGELPRAMHRLCSLNHIDLSMNHLFGDTAAAKNMFLCMKQLQIVDFSCNKITGSLSGWLEDLTSVTSLDISNNLLSGNLPENIGKLLPNLTYLDLSSNAIKGMLSEVHFDNLSSLEILILASNSLKIVIEPQWMPPFQLKGLGLHGCRVGPHFPIWLRSQTEIEMVDLGSTGIRSTLPDWLWNFSSSIISLDISNNSITGQLPTSLEQMKMLKILNIRSNQLVGGIPDLPTSVQVLDLSSNCLSGPLPRDLKAREIYYMVLSDNLLSGRIPTYICRMVLMEILVLSNNSFSGVLPDCWQNVSRLQTIDLSKNNFHGEIPITMGSITSLAMLSLRDNSLSGNFPTSLQSCRGLIFLDLAYNRLSGGIPTWIGDNQRSLLFLSLRSNEFSGEIPEQLCQLHSLKFLDLAFNNLSGSVPLSIGNLTSMQLYQDSFQEYTDEFSLFKLTAAYDVISPHLAVYVGTDSSVSNGRLLYRFVMSNIDLSWNQLTGEIPKEIGTLSSLIALNLSENQIGGSIPEEIGNLGFLMSLDLSRNNLSGSIPPSLNNLPQLVSLDLSYNVFGTRTPSSCQLDTSFVEEDPYVYSGNANPYEPRSSGKCLQHHGKHQHKIDGETYLCAMLGFASGLFTVSAILLFSATARKSYFQFTNSKFNEFRTAVAIKLNWIKAGRDQSMETGRVCSQNSITFYELEFGSSAPGH